MRSVPGSVGASLLVVNDLRAHLTTSRGVVRAVDGVSFDLQVGGSLAIVGESGSGKSMLLRSILNLLPGTSSLNGTVRFLNREVGQMSRREWRSVLGNDVAIVLQDPSQSLNPVLRLQTQLTEGLRHHRGVSRRQARTRALELLTSVGIPEPEQRLRQYPHQLSGGMRQRVAIAVALASGPKLLLADEITSSLDATVGARILDLIAGLQRRSGMAVISVTHDITVGAARSDELLVMYGGRVMETGPSDRVVSDPRHPYTRALIACVPRMSDGPQTHLEPIPGEPFDPLSVVAGCRFAPRCDRRTDVCVTVEPPVLVEADRSFSCHHPVQEAVGGVRETRVAIRDGQP